MSENKVAVITGGGTGIGAAIAEDLASTGVKVVITGRRPEPLAEVVNKITSQGGTAIAFPTDVTDFEGMERVVRETVERFGHIDLLVPNASVHDVSSFHDGNPAWWRTLIEINVSGLLFTVRATLPQLYRQGFGHIIIISSLSGRVVYVGEPIYIASKHAQVAIAECLRQEALPKGIKVTIIEPGLVETPFINNPFGQAVKKTVTPLEASDVARAVRYIFEQPTNVAINELAIRPVKQLL